MVAAALGLAWAAWTWDRAPAPLAVTALKPVLDDEHAAEWPVETAYGVPSARTLMLWRPFWPPAG